MPAYATPGPITATVEVAGAEVYVTAGDRSDTVVQVEPIDPTSRKDVTVAEKTKIDFAGGRLSVKTTVSGARTGSVSIKIGVPTGSDLTAYLAHSQLQADGTFGNSEVHMASGRARLDRTDRLKANLSTGEISIGQIAGRSTFDGASGTVRVTEARGPVGLSTSGGSAWIGHAAADLELDSSSCHFDIDRADGNVTASTASGAIRIGRLAGGHAKLMNGSGNIEVGISAGSAADIDADSERGAVRNSVPSQPGSQAAEVSVYARTRHGNIMINSVD